MAWLALLALCSAYLQGGLTKLFGWPVALAEMRHFGLRPASAFVAAAIALELGASVLVLTGWYRRAGALVLGIFTVAATLLANRFWEEAGPERFAMMNAFFEHLGLVGAFALVALHAAPRTPKGQP
jgi:uncharacterized membrane protein YphA (DoxX/SURF4 family)